MLFFFCSQKTCFKNLPCFIFYAYSPNCIVRNFIVSFQCCCCCCIRIYFVDIFGISIHTFVVVSHLPCSRCRCRSRSQFRCLSRTQAHTRAQPHRYGHALAHVRALYRMRFVYTIIFSFASHSNSPHTLNCTRLNFALTYIFRHAAFQGWPHI